VHKFSIKSEVTLIDSKRPRFSGPSCTVIARTGDAVVAGLEVRSEVALTRSYVDQRAYADVTRLATRALRVEQRDDVIGAAEVVVAPDAASQAHSPVHR